MTLLNQYIALCESSARQSTLREISLSLEAIKSHARKVEFAPRTAIQLLDLGMHAYMSGEIVKFIHAHEAAIITDYVMGRQNPALIAEHKDGLAVFNAVSPETPRYETSYKFSNFIGDYTILRETFMQEPVPARRQAQAVMMLAYLNLHNEIESFQQKGDIIFNQIIDMARHVDAGFNDLGFRADMLDILLPKTSSPVNVDTGNGRYGVLMTRTMGRAYEHTFQAAGNYLIKQATQLFIMNGHEAFGQMVLSMAEDLAYDEAPPSPHDFAHAMLARQKEIHEYVARKLWEGHMDTSQIQTALPAAVQDVYDNLIDATAALNDPYLYQIYFQGSVPTAITPSHAHHPKPPQP